MTMVVLLGTLDTKGIEYTYLRKRVEQEGCEVLLIDAGVQGQPLAHPDIAREQVAAAAGADVAQLAAAGDRGLAIETMARGATAIVLDLFAQGRLHGLLGLGGSGGSALATQAMRALPVGVPKLMVSTLASGDTRPYVGEVDVTMMYSVVDIAGINRISELILSNAATAMAGMAKNYATFQPSNNAKPLVGATMFGVTTPCVTEARQYLEERGYEVLVFHATGTGGRSMEALVNGNFLVGVLSAGPDRLEAAGKKALPQIVSLGALDMVNFGPLDTVPEKFRQRNLYRHNPTVTLMRTTPAECRELGRILANKLNQAQGPVVLFIPLRGISMIATEGGAFYDPEADRLLIEQLKSGLQSHVEVHELDMDINDPRFAQAMAQRLDELLHSQKSTQTTEVGGAS